MISTLPEFAPNTVGFVNEPDALLVMCTMFVRFFLMIFGICGMFWLLISLLTEETDLCTKRNKPKGNDKDVIANANNYWF